MKKKPNPAILAFRMAATPQRSNHWLDDYFRRMKLNDGNKYAIVATIYYNMVGGKIEFAPLDLSHYQKNSTNAKIAYLEKTLNSLKMAIA